MNISRFFSYAQRKFWTWIIFFASLLTLLGGVLRLWIPRPLFSKPYATLLYAKSSDSTEILLGARIAADGQWRFPAGQATPKKFTQSLLLYEDKRFFSHGGIDFLALARAVGQNLSRGRVVSGGSTLTMQLARLARGNRPRNFFQKGIEMLWAVFLEICYSKQEILDMYTAQAPFGGNVVGLQAASWRYFGRSAEDLSWAEYATLAVLPNAPSLIHPGKNRVSLKSKRDDLLRRLYENKIIDVVEYDLACSEPLPDKPVPLPNRAEHLLSRLATFESGKKFYVTLDPFLQQQIQFLVNQYVAEYRSNFIYNAAALVADVETGEILAYVGNTTEKGLDDSQGTQVDVITSPRSTGSILKPFLYAGMLHDGLLLPETLVADVPINLRGFSPQNFNRKFHGAVSARSAIEQSLNVPLVRMLSEYNTGRFMQLLKKLGMTTLWYDENHYGASLILGGAEATLLDITGMYASLARQLSHYQKYNGMYAAEDIHPLTCFSRRKKSEITSLADRRLSQSSFLSNASVWFMLEAMTGLNRPEEESDWQNFSSMKRVAWKTGTSFGGRDAWAVGVTAKFVVGIWVGNASGEGRAGLSGVGYAAPILFDVFSLLPDSEWFPKPYDELVQTSVCRQSGHRASENCPDVDTVYIPSSGISSPTCPYHRRVHLSPDGRYRVNSSCEKVSHMLTRSWFVLPPAMAYYYRNFHLDYKPLPPLRKDCEEENSQQMSILYPEHNSVIFLPKGFTGESEKLVMKATHVRQDAKLFWHLDDVYLGTTETRHELAAFVGRGNHILTLVDELGNKRSIFFEVK